MSVLDKSAAQVVTTRVVGTALARFAGQVVEHGDAFHIESPIRTLRTGSPGADGLIAFTVRGDTPGDDIAVTVAVHATPLGGE